MNLDSVPNSAQPAYPREDYQTTNAPGQSGLTKRELFAMAAMQGLYAGYYASREGIAAVRYAARDMGISDSQMIALASVEGADELLAQLAKAST